MFHVVECNGGKEMYKIARDARAKLLFFHINILIFVVLLTVTVVVGFVVIQK